MAAGVALELHKASTWRIQFTFHFETGSTTSTFIF